MARSKSRRTKLKGKYKSGLEVKFAKLAFEQNLSVEYEPDRFEYVKKGHYTPDWKIARNTYIETKGYFTPANRGDLLTFKEQYPHITIYLLFQEPTNKLNKRSKTTYEQWARKHGFECSGIRQPIPTNWFRSTRIR